MGKTRNFCGNQCQPPTAFIKPFLELAFVGRQRVEQKCSSQSNFQNLRTQLFQCSSARVVCSAAHQHVGSGHFLQVRQVFFKVFDGVLDLKRKQPGQACAVSGGCHVWLVKHFNRYCITQVNQRWKTNQGLRTLGNFHQLRQLPKRPGGEAFRDFDRYCFRSCLRSIYAG